MSFNQEGVSQRGDQAIQNTSQDQQAEFNPQSFSKQRTVGQRSQNLQKRLTFREKKNIKGHIFLEPKWNNSFHIEDPTGAIVVLIFIFAYLFCLYFDKIESNTKKIILGIAAIILYVGECCSNGIAGYLRNQITVKELQNYLNEIKQMQFELKFQVTAYHKDNSFLKSNRRRSSGNVTTYEETFEYPVGQSLDETEDSTVFFQKAKFFRIHNFVTYSFGDKESAQYYADMVKYAKNKSKNKDNYQTEKELMNCLGLKSTLVAYQDGVKIDPMLNIYVYVIYCALGLSLLYRILLNKRVCLVEHCIHKKLFLDKNRINPEIHQFQMTIESISNQQTIINNQEQTNQQLIQQISNQNKDQADNSQNAVEQSQQINNTYPKQPSSSSDVPNPLN